MELIFNPCSEFRWSPEGPIGQIHFLHLHDGTPGIFSDLLRSVYMLKREWGAKSNGKLPQLFIPSKTFRSWVCGESPAFRQNCSLGAWVCSERPAPGQYTLMMISIPLHHTTSYSSSFTVLLARTWNSLPPSIRDCPMLSQFKNIEKVSHPKSTCSSLITLRLTFYHFYYFSLILTYFIVYLFLTCVNNLFFNSIFFVISII